MYKKSTKLEALNGIFEENGITQGRLPFQDDLIHEIKKNADAIPDYRHLYKFDLFENNIN